ncbi:hypothetical protein P280DRAFT_443859 [Massarina eburnea CBS 473.64]|uniref:Zn(2)-C6 fungal-type domain-containing protein n=1 Tax=Massarina eburnea CBS 473.64 TaxID=1395130 RepID=A0A6A6SAL9_9PLEO|nr:hypothetical protein P280DRAFT_443859 [Massarina eburnea CBS 473.64]
MPVASRQGRRIASKACDTCRVRKVQCIFEGESAACRRCADSRVDCTFLSDRKPRGPVARRTPANLNLPVGELSIEHFCPKATFRSIIDDFLQLVFPLLPLVHRPSFRTSIESAAYTADPAFFRLCLAICAVTVASIPRKFEEYGRDKYADVGAMVDRACHMVLLSRIASEPEFQNQPTMATMIVSILLTMASHYAGRANQGWGYASEAIQFFRTLELYRKERYEGLSLLDREMCKRAFWMLYIIQIHDRLSFIIPHTGLSFDPLRTDWEFLLPCEIDDDDLVLQDHASLQNSNGCDSPPTDRPLPVISGFVALVKVFLCVVDLLSDGFPGSPPQAYAMTLGTLRTQTCPNNPVDGILNTPGIAPTKSTISLSALLRIIRKLQTTLEELPPVLRISSLDPQLQSNHTHPSMTSELTNQFDIMRANIHITSLYIQSSILEACSNAFTNPQSDSCSVSPGAEPSSPGHTPRTQLWVFRKSIARELLEVLRFCSSRTLEANGSSMIVKIREIAATLLDSDLEVKSDREEQSRQYVAQFADILANLDYMGQATIIPPIFSGQ